jgi:hypothetical protein
LEGHFAFQDYAISKWFFHVNAFVKSGTKFLEESRDRDNHLDAMADALDDFMMQFDEQDWSDGAVEACKPDCDTFQGFGLHENLYLLTSHIYTFQHKGFEAKHQISIKGLLEALERNRKLLEDLYPKLSSQKKDIYSQFYDEKRRFKCTRITCRYFSEGFADASQKKKHINMHNRPFHCDVTNCLGNEGFTNNNDLLKLVYPLPVPTRTLTSSRHTRAFHPETCDLADKFRAALPEKRQKAVHACTLCNKTFTRKFHQRDHELSHRGQRPHECPECGRAFTRLNDMKRHQKIHERK